MPTPFRQLPWPKLTLNGSAMPQFRVARRPMFSLGVLTEVGQPVPPQIVVNKLRLRQLYEARLVEPIGGIPPAYQIPAHRAAALSAAPTPPPLPLPVSSSAPAVGGYVPPRKRKGA